NRKRSVEIMKKISLLLSGIAFIGILTVGISPFSKADQFATHGHYPAPTYSVGDHGGAPQQS
ncbi:hypothetical protein, partial [Bacillus cereus]|uniref:hypothetical protein n=2 Tax=Bacillus TaxID=1386 RepID=UPI001C5579D5